MPLPIAQLGYMPSGGSPGQLHRPLVPPSAWEQLAQQALTAVVTQGLGNAMSRDYATQATAENPEQVKAGPFIDSRYGPSRARTKRSSADPRCARCSVWSRVLQGPQMDSRQYGAMQVQRAQSAEGRADRGLKASEGKANRDTEMAVQKERVTQAANQFSQTNQLGRDELAQRTGYQNADLGLRANALEQQGRLGAMNVINDSRRINASEGPSADSSTRAILQMASETYKVRMEQWNSQALIAKSRNLPPPPQPTLVDAIQEAAQGAVKMGFMAPTPSMAPPVPLVSP